MLFAALIDVVAPLAIPVGVLLGLLVVLLTRSGRKAVQDGYEQGRRFREKLVGSSREDEERSAFLAHEERSEQLTERKPPANPGREESSEQVTRQRPRAVPTSEEFEATLRRSSWLRRVFDGGTPEGRVRVEYNGRGIGHESVFVDGARAREVTSFFWFVPRFDFLLGRRPGVIEVRVWPWLTVRSFRLWVDGVCVYSEG